MIYVPQKHGTSSIRGMDIRCRLARSAIAAAVGDTDLAGELEMDAFEDAVGQGLRDASDGVRDLPAMFQGTVLAQDWEEGANLSSQIEADRDCHVCQGDAFTSCPWHC